MKNTVDDYLNAATRPSTRRSYQSAVEHFEVSWGGYLPATADSIVRYVTDYAKELSVNTLRQRLAALAQWHHGQGFPDPTKSPSVRKVIRGIRRLHPSKPKQVKPLAIQALEEVDGWLAHQIEEAKSANDHAAELKAKRDRAIVLIGFWRGFRSDELSRLAIEHIQISQEGMSLYLPSTKTNEEGVNFRAPLLSRLCPTKAYEDWLGVSGLVDGPAFRSINRWGQLSVTAIKPLSYVKLLRTLFERAGLQDAEEFGSHSLRRGFATWASASGWSLKDLMEYVGWKDIGSAMRYIDVPDPFGQLRIEQRLQQTLAAPVAVLEKSQPYIELSFTLESYHLKKQGVAQAREAIETCCLKAFDAKPVRGNKDRYRLNIQYNSDDQLTEIIDSLLDEMHEVATSRQCFLIAQFTDPVTGRCWE
ncbi:site-specific integrase [Cellvibrio sp.]|uniref:site-specific integrase n=1 Tax=Cellvibrio sp. TaxID=1965322 RepID=UPI00396478D0